MTVHLVGAGPGDPGLITVRGADLLARADVVIYDRLSAVELLDLAPSTAERICVAKAPNGPTVPQERINELLVEHGRRSGCVVRLKGGDPFVFARGGEEVATLIEAGIDFEVVSGITSAIAAPAAAGIPVTMRHSSTSFTVVTGHEDPAKGFTSVDWDALGRIGGTIVLLMGVGRIQAIVDALLEAGRSPETPAAAVRWGTRPAQSSVRSTLIGLPEAIRAADLGPPATIVIGEVAGLDLGWFDRRPLFGRSVVVTRARAQASELCARLRALGAEVIEAPTIETVDPEDGGVAMTEALHQIPHGRYRWLVVTSPNGASRVLGACHDARALAGVKVAAIGPGTRDRLAGGGIIADLVPGRSVAEGLLEVFETAPPEGGRVLLARAASAREVLPDGLAELGWKVDDVPAYRTRAVEADDETRQAVSEADLVTFTSSSTVENLLDAVGADKVPARIVSIGPITSTTVAERGLEVTAEAAEATLDGLVTAVCEALEASDQPGSEG